MIPFNTPRALSVLVAVVGVILARTPRTAGDAGEVAAVKLFALVREQKGRAELFQHRDGTVTAHVAVEYLSPPPEAAAVQILSAGVSIERLELAATSFGEGTAKGLRLHATPLREVTLTVGDPPGEVSPEVIRALAGCKDLQSLALRRASLPPATRQELGKVAGLRTLRLQLMQGLADGTIDFVGSFDKLRELDLAFSRLPVDLAPLTRLRTLRTLNLVGVPDPDTILEALAGNRGLEDVNLDGAGVPGAQTTFRGLRALAQTTVREVNLNNVPLDIGMARELARFPNLARLSFRRVVREGAFPELCKCSELEDLSLLGAQVPPDDLAAVAKLRRLRRLSADQPVTEGLVRGLGECRQLEALSLTGAGLTDGMVKALAQLPRLGDLSVRGNNLTDQALRDLERSPALRRLELRDSAVTEASLVRFRKACPWVDVAVE